MLSHCSSVFRCHPLSLILRQEIKEDPEAVVFELRSVFFRVRYCHSLFCRSHEDFLFRWRRRHGLEGVLVILKAKFGSDLVHRGFFVSDRLYIP